MSFIVISPSQVEKDGINYGKVGDAIANNKNDASEIQLALEVWGNELMQQVADVPGLRSRISQLEQELESYRNPPQPEQDWAGLGMAIASSGLYAKLTTLIEGDLLEPQTETTLLNTLFRIGMAATWTRNLPALLDGINKIREVLAVTPYALTQADEDEISATLTQHGFTTV